MALQDVRVVSVPVSDQDRAKEFYVEKLGHYREGALHRVDAFCG